MSKELIRVGAMTTGSDWGSAMSQGGGTVSATRFCGPSTLLEAGQENRLCVQITIMTHAGNPSFATLPRSEALALCEAIKEAME